MVGVDGTLVLLGLPTEEMDLKPAEILKRRKTVTGSFIGGMPETQAMLDFCGKHNITPDCEMINASQIGEAFQRTMNGDVKYRFVLDCSSIKSPL